MMRILKYNFALAVLLLAYHASVAQLTIPDNLKVRLVGRSKFHDIRATVRTFYQEEIKKAGTESQKKGFNREIKFWNRYFHESESRLNDQGEVENSAQRVYDYLSSNEGNLRTTSVGGSWRFVGPTNVSSGIGRINRIACDPANQSILYAGSAAGGLFKTINAGLSWTSVSSFIPSLGISGIVVSHSNSNTIYILTGDGDAWNSGGFNFQFGYVRYSVGILKSTNGGLTWTKTGDLPGTSGRFVGFKLVQDPNNANILLAATSEGLYRTTDAGETWTLCDFTNLSNDNRRVFDIEFKPGSSATVYCTTLVDGTAQFYRSTTSGTTFGAVAFTNSALNKANRIEIAVTPANSSHVYLLCGPGYYKRGDNSDDRFQGLYRSTNDGQSFTLRSNEPDILGYDDILNTFKHQSDYDLAIAASPSNANTILTGGLVVWRSTNGGTDWSEVVDYFEDTDNSNFIHPDVHDLVYNPLNGKLYAATDGGVAVSSDNGSNWSRLFGGLSCTQFYRFGLQDDGGDIWGGAQDNGILIKDGSNSTFDEYAGGDGFDVLTDLPPAGNQDDKYYVVNTHVYADATIDEDVSPPGIDHTDVINFFPNLAMHPTNEDIIYAGYITLFISLTRGSSWTAISDGTYNIPGNWSLATCPSNANRVYTAGNNNGFRKGLYRIDNVTQPFRTVSDLNNALFAVGYPGDRPKITDIAVQPNNSNRVWITMGDFRSGKKVFFSSNGGTSWTNISGSLPNLPANCVLADNDGNVYIGTDIGVYYRGATDTDWTPFYNDLPRVPVTELEFMTIGVNVAIYASTYGRGIWSSDLHTTCPSTVTVNQQLQGQQFYQAGSTLNSTSAVNGVMGTEVYFKAGSTVNLTPGFEAIRGTEFKAYIQPCDNEVPQRIVPIKKKAISASNSLKKSRTKNNRK